MLKKDNHIFRIDLNYDEKRMHTIGIRIIALSRLQLIIQLIRDPVNY